MSDTHSLKSAREARGLSQRAAAAAVGVGRRTWIRWEQLPTLSVLPLAKLERVAATLKTSIKALRGPKQ